uniref:CSON014203 protein n=1 Tax=Culicoides sonorensis TaxID=179676 RepID=A0A336MFL8_CULSO
MNNQSVHRHDIGTNCNSRPVSPVPVYDEYITPGGVSVIRSLTSNERVNVRKDNEEKDFSGSTIIQIYNSKESTPVRMRRRSDSGHRRQSVPKLWSKNNFQSSADMDRHLISDPSLTSLDTDLRRPNHLTTTDNSTDYLNDIYSPVSDSVTTTGGHRNHFYYHQNMMKPNLTSNMDTIVLSPGAIFNKSSSSPSGLMQRASTHFSDSTKTILIPLSKVSDEFMYSLEHVL